MSNRDRGSKEFGARLRQWRIQAGLSLRELAARVGVNFTSLSKIENGTARPPSEDVIHRLATVLSADEEYLLTLSGRIPLIS